MKKRLLSLFLVLTMLISLIPSTFVTPAFAEPGSSKPVVKLGDAIWTNQSQSKFSYSNATVSYSSNIYLLTVTSNKENSVPKSITVGGKTETANMTDVKGMSSTWLYLTPKSAEEVQARIRALELTWTNGMQVTITVDGNALQGFDNIQNSGATLTQYNGHYYMFMPYPTNTSLLGKTWNKAYTAAKQFVLGGMRGYLATITTDGEQKFLQNILGAGDAWTGGTAITTNSNGSMINDPLQITDAQAASFYYRTINGTKFCDAGNKNDYYYWACGPEAGQPVVRDGVNCNFDAYQSSPQDVDNNIDKNNKNLISINNKILESTIEMRMEWGGGQLNDIFPNYGSGYETWGGGSIKMAGYFVEFGGYTNDPGQLDKTKVVKVTSDKTPSAKEASIDGTVYGTVEAGFTTLNKLSSAATLQLEKASGLTQANNQTLKTDYSVQSQDKSTKWTAKDDNATVSVASDGKITLNSGALKVAVRDSAQGKTTVGAYEVSSGKQYTVTASDANSPFNNGSSVTATAANQVITAVKDGVTYTYTATAEGQTFYLGEYSIAVDPETGSHVTLGKPNEAGKTSNPYYMADYTFTLTPEANYDLHGGNIKVKMGNKELTQVSDNPGAGQYKLTQNAQYGACNITVPDVTGDIVVNVAYTEGTPEDQRPVTRQMTEITVSGLKAADGAAVGQYTATSEEDNYKTTYTPDKDGKITVPRNAEVKLVFTPAASADAKEFSLLTSLKADGDDTELLSGAMKNGFEWKKHSYTYTYTPTDKADSFTAVFTPAHVVDVAVTNGSATFTAGTVLESKGAATGNGNQDWSGKAIVANKTQAALTFNTDAKNIFHRAWLGVDEVLVDGFDGNGYTFDAGTSYDKLKVEFHPGWKITVNTTETTVDNPDGAWQVNDTTYTQTVAPDSNLTIRFAPKLNQMLQSVTLNGEKLDIYALEQDEDGTYTYTLETIAENKTLTIGSTALCVVTFYPDKASKQPLGDVFYVAKGSRLSQKVLAEKKAMLTIPEGQSFYAWEDKDGTYYTANTDITKTATKLYPVYRQNVSNGEDGTVIEAENFMLNVAGLNGGSLSAEQAKQLSGVEALNADGTLAAADAITVSDTSGITGAGKYDITFSYGKAKITVKATVVDTRPAVTGKTAHSLNFIGEPNTTYTVKKSDGSGHEFTVTTDANGKGVTTGLEKATEYQISHKIYGSTTATTSLVDAADIAKQFTTAGDATSTNSATDLTEKAWNSKVDVTIGDDGNYKVTVKENINQTVQVPDIWENVTVDLNGNNIKGPDATDTTPAGPGIAFVKDSGANHPGTKLTIVDTTGNGGKVQGGNGAAGTYPDGAPGVSTDANNIPENTGITVNKGVTIVGGNGADGTTANANGGNGGAGITGKIEVTVDGGSIIGGNGGKGADSETTAGGSGGTGGAGIDTSGKDVTVNNGTVTGGNGGQGGTSTEGNGGQGGEGGDGVTTKNPGKTTVDKDGSVTGGNGGTGGSSEKGEGGNGGTGGNGTTGETSNKGEINGGNGGQGGTSTEGNGGTGGNGGSGVDGKTENEGEIIGGKPGNGGKPGAGTTDNNPTGGGTTKPGEDVGYGTLSATTNTVTVHTPKVGVHYAIYDEKGTLVGGVTAQIGQTGKDITFTGLSSNTTYIVKAEDNRTTVEVGTITTSSSYGGGGTTTPTKPDSKPTPGTKPNDPTQTGVAGWLQTSEHIAYLGGYGDGKFGPTENMTRAQAAQMFYNLLLKKNVDITENFTDVPADAWYGNAVHTLASLGIIKGIGNDEFAPNRTITRAEFAVIAMRFANVSGKATNPFSDVSENDWFYSAVTSAVSYGWIGGYSDGTFRPQATITRAEVVTIVNRMLNRTADRNFVDSNATTQFDDVPKTYWAYYNIMEATIAHDHSIDKDGVESWGKQK